MKLILLLSAAAMLTGLVSLTTSIPATADPLPGVYFGEWCGEHHPNADQQDKIYTKGDCDPNSIRFEIKPNGFDYGDGTCRFASVRKTGQSWPRGTKPKKGDWPKGDWVPEVDVTLKCHGFSSKLRLTWIKGDQLQIISR